VQEIMRKLHRPITFGDLAREWAGTDKNSYGAEMRRMAENYTRRSCAPQRLTERDITTALARPR
jgi:hypothetical protein